MRRHYKHQPMICVRATVAVYRQLHETHIGYFLRTKCTVLFYVKSDGTVHSVTTVPWRINLRI